VAERTTDLRVLAAELVRRMNEDVRRIRMLEQSIDRFEVNMSALEEGIYNQINELKTSLEKISENLRAVENKLALLDSDISKIKNELTKKATKIEVKEMEAYTSLLSPILTKFVTKEELETLLEEKLRRRV
jgi:DNA-binding transcriptional regulator GbsR (MarR family)